MSSVDLERLALGCIFPGFEGPTAPDWVRRRLSEGLGGVVLFAWNVESRAGLRSLTDALRAEREDVLIAIDEEGGDVTRLEAATGSSYPGNAALGVVDDVELTELVAGAMAAELSSVGVNVDLAPVADVNTNPLNPVIGIRSFGPDARLAARHVSAFVRGLQSAGVAACVKHFPGHGDTAQDSHLELPVVDSIEADALLPFRAAIEEGVQAVMTAHIVVRSLGMSPATMSREILHGLLREELGYAGLILSDALEMRAISATVGVEEGAVRAVAAGADALCLGHDLFDESVRGVCDALVQAVRSGRLEESRLVEASGRVRALSEWANRAPRPAEAVAGCGLTAARRAVQVVGDPAFVRPPLVVELEPEPGQAAGRLAQGPGEWFRALVPETETVRLREGAVDEALARANGRQLVVVTRDAHRHSWEQEAVETLLAAVDDAVVVELGLPYWKPAAASVYVTTHGAGRVNVEAAAERLYESTPFLKRLRSSTPGGDEARP